MLSNYKRTHHFRALSGGILQEWNTGKPYERDE
jgi:hypothetical protein